MCVLVWTATLSAHYNTIQPAAYQPHYQMLNYTPYQELLNHRHQRLIPAVQLVYMYMRSVAICVLPCNSNPYPQVGLTLPEGMVKCHVLVKGHVCIVPDINHAHNRPTLKLFVMD